MTHKNPLNKKMMLKAFLAILMLILCTMPSFAAIENGGFETGDFTGWTADSTWTINHDSHTWYAGWQGNSYAWSGKNGEPALGILKSKPFVLDKAGVRLMVAGWTSIHGTGVPRRWNYVALKLQDGTEIDRVWAPDSTTFVPVTLDGTKYKEQTVYIEAVDDADQPSFSMLCIDDVKIVDIPTFITRPLPSLNRFNPRKSVRITDDRYIVEVSRKNGAITRIYDKKGDIELIREPRLATGFKYALPIPGKEPWQGLEANYVISNEQKSPAVKVDGKKITLRWDAPLSSRCGDEVNASTTMIIELTADGVLMNMKVDNKTPYKVGEVFFPMLGGIQGIGHNTRDLKATEFVKPLAGGTTSASKIFYVFNNMSWLGDQGAEQYSSYPTEMPEPWIEFNAPKLERSVYIGAHDPAGRSLVARLEMYPGNSATIRNDGNWPRPEELRGQPVGVNFSFVHFAETPAGTVYDAAPILLRFHESGPSQAKSIYEAWEAGK